jgi:hypothetical protein
LTFATVRHRTQVIKGPGSKDAGIAMAFKLIDAAQERWRAINAPHLVELVRAGARFEGTVNLVVCLVAGRIARLLAVR